MSTKEGRTGDRRFPPVLYPTALILVVPLHIYVGASVSPYSALRTTLISIAIGLLVTCACTLAMGDRLRGGLLAALLVVLLIGGQTLLVAVAVLAMTALLVYHRIRRPFSIRWHLVTRTMQALVTILWLAIGIRAVQDGRLAETAYDLVHEWPLRGSTPAVGAARDAPDIYLIMLDGYLRPSKQPAVLGRDPTPFVDALRSRGFDVASASRSNFMVTAQSLPTFMDMRYVTDVAVELDRPPSDSFFRWAMNSNRAGDEVRRHGYQVVGISGGWEGIAYRGADVFVDGPPNDFELTVLAATALRPLVEAFAEDLPSDWHRARIEFVLDSVVKVADTDVAFPRLVFAHVPSPHAPFVFGADGSRVPPPPLSTFYVDHESVASDGSGTYADAYDAQVTYLERRVLETVDRVVSDSRVPPVVLLFSDHGSALTFDFQAPETSDIDERSATLVALRSQGSHGLLPDHVTLVNVLGPILAKYVASVGEPQEDRVYVWSGKDRVDLHSLPLPP